MKKNVFKLEISRTRIRLIQLQPIKALLLTGVINILTIGNNRLNCQPDLFKTIIFFADMTDHQLLDSLLIDSREQFCCLMII